MLPYLGAKGRENVRNGLLRTSNPSDFVQEWQGKTALEDKTLVPVLEMLRLHHLDSSVIFGDYLEFLGNYLVAHSEKMASAEYVCASGVTADL